MAAEAIHAFLARETDGADGETKLGGDFVIRTRGRFKKEKLDEAAALRRESGYRFAEHLLFLRLLNEGFGDGGSLRIGQIGIGVAADEALLLLLPAVALVMSHLHEPFGKRAGFAKLGKPMEKLDAGGLKNFGGFIGRQAVFDGDGIDERFVFFEEKRPSFLVAGETFLHEAFVAPRSRLLFGGLGKYGAHRGALSAPLRKKSCSTFQSR